MVTGRAEQSRLTVLETETNQYLPGCCDSCPNISAEETQMAFLIQRTYGHSIDGRQRMWSMN